MNIRNALRLGLMTTCLACFTTTAAARYPSFLVSVRADPRSPLTEKNIEALANSSACLGRALAEFDQIDPELSSLVQIVFDAPPAKFGRITGILQFDTAGELPYETGVEVLRRTIERMKSALQQAAEQEIEAMREAAEEAVKREADAAQQLKQIQVLRNELLNEADTYVLEREVLISDLRDLEEHHRRLQLSVRAREAERRALMQQLAELRDQVHQNVQADEVLKQLKEIHDIRQERLQNIQQLVSQGSAGEADLLKCREEVSEVSLRIVQRQQELAERSGAARINELKGRLLEIAVELAEEEAFAEATEAQLHELRERDILELADRYEREVTLRLPALRRDYERALRRKLEAQEALSGLTIPKVIIAGAPD